MINIKDKALCSGCSACAVSCPTAAIMMKEDYEGFKYPIVDKTKCIDCNKCERICPIQNFDEVKQDISTQISTHAYKSSNPMRLASSSGGVFFDIASEFINQKGVVVGAAFDEDFNLYHRIISNLEDLDQLMGSKYLQSDICNVYKEIKSTLLEGKKVLFVGLTCQVEGLKAFIGEDKNLYCVDLICMGVPSPKVWKIYLDTFFSKDKIKKINFKDKKLGWHTFSFTLEKKDGSFYSEKGFDNYYMECMFKGYSLRPSCFNCKFKCENKKSDCTIADCWGCETYLPLLDDNKGTSMIITHTEKGEGLLSILQGKGEMVCFDYSNVLKYNSHYQNCVIEYGNRDKFFERIFRKPEFYFKLYGKNPASSLVAKIMKKMKI